MKASALSALPLQTHRPRSEHFTIKFFHDSSFFLKPPRSLSYRCQHKGPYIFVSSSSSFTSVHIRHGSTLKSPVIQKSLGPALRPSRSTLTTPEMHSSYISRLFFHKSVVRQIQLHQVRHQNVLPKHWSQCPSVFMRGFCVATGQYSSFFVCAGI